MRTHAPGPRNIGYEAILASAAAMAIAVSAEAGITYTFDQSAWSMAAGGTGALTYIDFNTVPYLDFVTEQFAPIGVHFTDGNDRRVTAVWTPTGEVVPAVVSASIPPPPGDPLNGITMMFDVPQRAFAMQYYNPGHSLSFFLGNALIATIVVTEQPTSGFVGFLGALPFDRIVHNPYSPNSVTLLSNSWFSPIPGPAGMGLLAVAAVAGRQRRRSH